MSDLEERVRALTAQAVARDPAVLAASVSGERLEGSQDEVNSIVMRALGGLREALLEIAREVDRLGS